MNIDDPVSELRVTDRASGQTIVVLRMTQSELTRMIRGGVANFDAWLVPPDLRPRLGLEMKVEFVDIPKDVAGPYDRNATAAAEAWAEENRKPRHESIEVRRGNDGWRAIYRWWVAP